MKRRKEVSGLSDLFISLVNFFSLFSLHFYTLKQQHQPPYVKEQVFWLSLPIPNSSIRGTWACVLVSVHPHPSPFFVFTFPFFPSPFFLPLFPFPFLSSKPFLCLRRLALFSCLLCMLLLVTPCFCFFDSILFLCNFQDTRISRIRILALHERRVTLWSTFDKISTLANVNEVFSGI